MLMLMVLCLTSFPTVSAAPIHLADVSGGTACLAVFISVFSLLSILLISKRIYLKARKSKHVPAHFEKLSARSSAPILSFTEDNSVKAAFLVGFFGSPAWETDLKNIDQTKSLDNQDLHFSLSSCQYSSSRRSRSSRMPYSSSSNSASMIRGSPPVLMIDDVNVFCKTPDRAATSVQENTASLILPTRPSLAYHASSSMTMPRRFSMPTVSRRDINSLGRIKRASSQSTRKNTTIGHADFSVSSLADNPSLRLVQAISNSDHPLPLSRSQSRCFATRCSSSIPIGPTASHAPQLLPVLRSRSVTDSQNDLKLSSRNKRRISHPFALTPSSTYVAQTIAKNLQSPTHVKMTNVQPDQEPASTLRPLSPVLLSIDLSPPSMPVALNNGLTSGPSVRSSYEKNVVFPKIKQRQPRKSSLRLRRSPTIGPSPLRAMILPDSSDPKVAVRATLSQAGSQTSSHSHDYFNLGLGFPGSPLSTTCDVQEVSFGPDKGKSQAERNNDAHRVTVDTEDANTLVGMIRELVEETDQWDASLFKDKNFKTMINDSKQALKGSLSRAHVADPDLSHRYHSVKTEEDKSCEVDLSLLGLDIFRSGGETFIPILEDKGTSLHNDEPHLFAIWENSVTRTTEQDHAIEQGSVGLAC